MKTALVKSQATAAARTEAHARLTAEGCMKFECAIHDHAHVANLALGAKCKRPACKAHRKPFVMPRRQRRKRGNGPRFGRFPVRRNANTGPVRPPGRGFR